MTRNTRTPRSVDRTPHDALAEATLALARPLAADRVLDEVVRQVERALRPEGVAVAISDSGDPDDLVLAAHSGFRDTNDAVADRLRHAWRRAIESAALVADADGSHLTLTAPIRSGQRATGAVTVVIDPPAADAEREASMRLLGGIAAHAAAALERAAAVRRLEHRQRVATVDEVSVGLAHDLRNRLFGISSAAQLLRFRINEDPAVEKNIGRILREVERMNGTVNALLEFGQPAPTTFAPGDPDAVWDAVLEAQRGQFESKALKLVRTRPPAPANCAIDAGQLATAFTHLVVNATDAAPEGTDLALTSAMAPGGGWQCRLANGGPVMGPETLRRAFDLFYTSKEGGTGMGLPLARRILQDHGGSLALESSSAAGTVAVVTLPATPP